MKVHFKTSLWFRQLWAPWQSNVRYEVSLILSKIDSIPKWYLYFYATILSYSFIRVINLLLLWTDAQRRACSPSWVGTFLPKPIYLSHHFELFHLRLQMRWGCHDYLNRHLKNPNWCLHSEHLQSWVCNVLVASYLETQGLLFSFWCKKGLAELLEWHQCRSSGSERRMWLEWDVCYKRRLQEHTSITYLRWCKRPGFPLPDLLVKENIDLEREPVMPDRR